ncbi:MAG: hypothetical protein IPP59_09315 [Betaproteobacteria bacterium]|nr:hypothetical protein [Candidatus Dechloromonas phosphorivorans]
MPLTSLTRGYCDYNWWANIDAQHARFVTRFNYNAALRVDTSRPIAAADRDTILEDQIVRFAYRHQGRWQAQSLREATPAHRRRSA